MPSPELTPDTPLRRVGVVGDVHTEDAALATALSFFATQSLDAVLCVGDVLDGHGDAERTCTLLREHPVLCVRGNHERWFARGGIGLSDATPREALSPASLAFIASLPATRTLTTVSGPLLLCHGVGENDMARLLPDDEGYGLASQTELWALHAGGAYAWMVGGHTHRRMARAFDHLRVLNAGTLFRANDPCVLIADFAALEASFYDLAPGTTPRPAQRYAFAAGA